LWLRREDRSVSAAPADIMEAIVGVPIAPDRLLAVLSGCAAKSLDITRAARHGRLLSIETADARVQLEQTNGQWRAKAAQTDAFTVEFGAMQSGLPSELWMWSIPGRGPAASLHLRATDPELNGEVPAGVFKIPSGAAAAKPITLEELKAAGPWREREPVPEGP
jgi:hypothetical protein